MPLSRQGLWAWLRARRPRATARASNPRRPALEVLEDRTLLSAGLSLSNASAPEFRPVGTAVGTLSTSEPGAGHSFTYDLVGGAGSADNAAFSVLGDQLRTADAFDAAAQSSYSVRVRSTDENGQTFEQPFTIQVSDDPNLARVGRTLSVRGTTGHDAFTFAPGPVQDSLTLNGVDLAVDATSVDAIAFAGGNASVTLTAPDGGGSTLTLVPGGGTLTGPGPQVILSGVAQVGAFGGPGDRAYLNGSAANDVFVGSPGYSYLYGPGYLEQAVGFGVAQGSGQGGSDAAYLFGAPAAGNAFVSTPAYSYLYGPGFFNQANGFQTAIGYSERL
jgi:hypothetical protein